MPDILIKFLLFGGLCLPGLLAAEPEIELKNPVPAVDIKTYATHMFLTASIGVACEIIFTALYDFVATKNPHLRGYTYVWMLALYASIYPLHRAIYPKIAHWRAPLRYALYVSMIYASEYTSGRLLRSLLGSAPWEQHYQGQPWAVHDLIRLDYAPAWFAAAFLFEDVCNTLNKKLSTQTLSDPAQVLLRS